MEQFPYDSVYIHILEERMTLFKKASSNEPVRKQNERIA